MQRATGWILLIVGLYSVAPGLARAASPAGLEGVTIEAVEGYPDQSPSALLFGAGIYPFNPYYLSYSVDLAYDYRVSRGFTWEILGLSYLMSSDTDLLSRLAGAFGVTPQTIERPNFSLRSEAFFSLAYGKFLAFDDKIRFFNAGILLGLGALQTSQSVFSASNETTTRENLYPTFNLGLRFNTHVSSSLSFRVEIHDALELTAGLQNVVTFHLGGGFSL